MALMWLQRHIHVYLVELPLVICFVLFRGALLQEVPYYVSLVRRVIQSSVGGQLDYRKLPMRIFVYSFFAEGYQSVENSKRKMIGDTEIMKGLRGLVVGKESFENVQKLIRERSSSVNLEGLNGVTALHVACSPATSVYKERRQAVIELLTVGANAFAVDSQGRTPLDMATAGADQEQLVSTILEYRLSTEQHVPSVAPLFASRLMKRVKEDRGAGIFSNVARHCLYYLYKGALYLWDTSVDEEHVVYQPRTVQPRIATAVRKLDEHQRKKSFVAHGGVDTTYDVNDEDILVEEIKQLESRVAMVHHFTLANGLDCQHDPIGSEGVTEWLLCDTGVLIAVKMDRHGVVLVSGELAGKVARRKSHVCGATATYPAGMAPNIRVFERCCLHFFRTPEASQVCCCIDGLHGVVGYALSASPEDTKHDTSVLESQNSSHDQSSSNTFRAFQTHVEFSLPEDEAATQGPSPFLPPDAERNVFRVVHFTQMEPKVGFDAAMKNLCSRWDPFAGCSISEYSFPEDVVPLSVQQCGSAYMIAFTSGGVFAADVSTSPAQFFAVKTNPVGPIVCGVARPQQRFSQVKLKHVPCNYFVQVSQVVEVMELKGDRECVCLFRILPDRTSPHRYFPLFHPSEDALVVLYQSPLRQEVTVLNFTTRKMRSLCRLPRPSSLRFFNNGCGCNDLCELCFAFSNDGQFVMRYNVSMHVMSIYSWSEVVEECSQLADAGVINAVFCRDPVPVVNPRAVVTTQVQKPVPHSENCVWMIVEALHLRKSQSDAVVQETLACVGRLLHKIVMAHTGNVKWTPEMALSSPERRPVSPQDGADPPSPSFSPEKLRMLSTIWASTFAVGLDAMRASISLLRELTNADWSAEVTNIPEYSPVLLEYRPKSTVEKMFPGERDRDVAATKYLRRGPTVRVALTGGALSGNPLKLLAPLRAVVGDTKDGSVVVEGLLMKSLSPLMEFFAVSPVAKCHVGRITCIVPGELEPRLAQ